MSSIGAVSKEQMGFPILAKEWRAVHKLRSNVRRAENIHHHLFQNILLVY